ncbi:hypothetical protein A3Q56_00129 [Intoshia linei]|uniref:Serine/threonine protein phosphatase 2A regulatory subunit n=1 Tax=Intoshia linei TaxID=1819745 RepID=A0A177BCZ5_9BILA|nr:hypothetical protein A3Q56_00129 [Intoshia linei]
MRKALNKTREKQKKDKRQLTSNMIQLSGNPQNIQNQTSKTGIATTKSHQLCTAPNHTTKKRFIVPIHPNAKLCKELEDITPLSDASSLDREQLLIKKIIICEYIFDFSIYNGDHMRWREIKRKRLIEIISYLSHQKSIINHTVCPHFFNMLSVNIFRDMVHTNPVGPQYDVEEDEAVLDAVWPHLMLVFEIFLKVIESSDFTMNFAKKYLQNCFLVKLIHYFDSEDPREREFLKTILHRIYGKFLGLRPSIRKIINNVIYQFIYETEHHNGIMELLEILGSIINGFSIPLKQEHKIFFSHILMPLHKNKSLSLYHPQLVYCTLQFVEKESSLVRILIHFLLKYWPKLNSTKEVQFINELEEILDIIDGNEFEIVAADVFKQIAKCVDSTHFQVAERALYLWNNEIIVGHIATNIKIILPIMYPVLQKNPEDNWNKTTNGLVYNTLKVFMEINQKLFDEFVINYSKIVEEKNKNTIKRVTRWASIINKAKTNPLYQSVGYDIDLKSVPRYQDYQRICKNPINLNLSIKSSTKDEYIASSKSPENSKSKKNSEIDNPLIRRKSELPKKFSKKII